ncbi:Down syndrome cell adhesion molecule-like protein 1-like [Exaiptasia diaphana]|nr:Down syndrome cell adhesion molecule-like protein 1-like [Exaiptasia diaphana]
MAPDCAPKIKSVNALSSTSIRVTWDPLPNTNCRNGILRGYKVLYRRPRDRYWQASNVGPAVKWKDIESLQKYTTYMFKVVAYTVKDSEPSKTITRKTSEDVPEGKPSHVSATPKSSTSIEVTWKVAKPLHQSETEAENAWPAVLPRWAKFNGPSTGFRITYTDARRIKKTKLVRNVRKALLTNLNKWMTYSITVSMWNSRYYGTESSIATATTKEDVPDIAPQGIEVTEQNKTTFIIAWQPLPRNKANGKITMYKIVWALRHIGRAKRMAVGDTFTGTTKGTQFVLLGLRLCAQYEVHVAAATIAGLGPNATQGVTTSRPGEPHNLKSRRIGKSFITLTWEKPKGMIEDETDYMVCAHQTRNGKKS